METVADYVRLSGVTNLVIGKTWQSVGKKVGIEDKFIARLPNVKILIVPDNQRFPYRGNSFKEFFTRVFTCRKLLRKYKTANRILDINDLLARAAYESENGRTRAIAEILARAFLRSCVIYTQDCTVVSWKNEDVDFLTR